MNKTAEFLCSHFNTEDGEKATFLAYYALLVQEKKKHNWNTNKFCVVYGEIAVTDQIYHKWFVKLRAGDFSLDDALQLGRLADVDSNEIETWIENSQCYIIWDTANILKIKFLNQVLKTMCTSLVC